MYHCLLKKTVLYGIFCQGRIFKWHSKTVSEGIDFTGKTCFMPTTYFFQNLKEIK